MIGFVIWIIGLILTFRAAIEIWNINAAVEKRLIAIVLNRSYQLAGTTFLLLLW